MYTQAAYVALIELLKREGCRFAGFDEPAPAGERLVFLRHDIDYSPRWAERLARMNRDLGISGLFCFLLRSPLYNLAAAETQRHIETILGLGQKIGLHYAFAAPPPDDLAAIAALVQADFAAARALVPAMAPVFAWHNPSLSPGLIERSADLEVGGLVNAYGRRFFVDSVYKSDSNWRYPVEQWPEIARAGHKRLHLLLHPYLWLSGGRDMRDVMARTFAEVAGNAQAEFANNRVFAEMHPDGLGEQALAAIAAAARGR